MRLPGGSRRRGRPRSGRDPPGSQAVEPLPDAATRRDRLRQGAGLRHLQGPRRGRRRRRGPAHPHAQRRGVAPVHVAGAGARLQTGGPAQRRLVPGRDPVSAPERPPSLRRRDDARGVRAHRGGSAAPRRPRRRAPRAPRGPGSLPAEGSGAPLRLRPRAVRGAPSLSARGAAVVRPPVRRGAGAARQRAPPEPPPRSPGVPACRRRPRSAPWRRRRPVSARGGPRPCRRAPPSERPPPERLGDAHPGGAPGDRARATPGSGGRRVAARGRGLEWALVRRGVEEPCGLQGRCGVGEPVGEPCEGTAARLRSRGKGARGPRDPPRRLRTCGGGGVGRGPGAGTDSPRRAGSPGRAAAASAPAIGGSRPVRARGAAPRARSGAPGAADPRDARCIRRRGSRRRPRRRIRRARSAPKGHRHRAGHRCAAPPHPTAPPPPHRALPLRRAPLPDPRPAPPPPRPVSPRETTIRESAPSARVRGPPSRSSALEPASGPLRFRHAPCALGSRRRPLVVRARRRRRSVIAGVDARWAAPSPRWAAPSPRWAALSP